ncbi:hypothetical protein APA_2120 [Pseudanabaena sp. lw0831]|nr:hypothetical protein APA_2120 [Pseudanabaena sp. lw0831]
MFCGAAVGLIVLLGAGASEVVRASEQATTVTKRKLVSSKEAIFVFMEEIPQFIST